MHAQLNNVWVIAKKYHSLNMFTVVKSLVTKPLNQQNRTTVQQKHKFTANLKKNTLIKYQICTRVWYTIYAVNTIYTYSFQKKKKIRQVHHIVNVSRSIILWNQLINDKWHRSTCLFVFRFLHNYIIYVNLYLYFCFLVSFRLNETLLDKGCLSTVGLFCCFIPVNQSFC